MDLPLRGSPPPSEYLTHHGLARHTFHFCLALTATRANLGLAGTSAQRFFRAAFNVRTAAKKGVMTALKKGACLRRGEITPRQCARGECGKVTF